MISWISYPTNLMGETVDLLSLEKKHFAELETLAKDKRIWEFYTYDGSDPDIFLDILLLQ